MGRIVEQNTMSFRTAKRKVSIHILLDLSPFRIASTCVSCKKDFTLLGLEQIIIIPRVPSWPEASKSFKQTIVLLQSCFQ